MARKKKLKLENLPVEIEVDSSNLDTLSEFDYTEHGRYHRDGRELVVVTVNAHRSAGVPNEPESS